MITKIINGERQRSTCCTWGTRKDAGIFFRSSKVSGQTAKDRELINRYLETGNNLEGREAILHYQNGRLKDYNLAKNRRETDAIDAVMREVPEVPKDFDAWIQKWGFAGKSTFSTKEKDPGQKATAPTVENMWRLRIEAETQYKSHMPNSAGGE